MNRSDEIVNELKHLIGYYQQAAHEFFDDTSSEFQERTNAVYGCLEQNQNTLETYQAMVQELVRLQQDLKKKVDDLGFLTERMLKLFEKE